MILALILTISRELFIYDIIERPEYRFSGSWSLSCLLSVGEEQYSELDLKSGYITLETNLSNIFHW